MYIVYLCERMLFVVVVVGAALWDVLRCLLRVADASAAAAVDESRDVCL